MKISKTAVIEECRRSIALKRKTLEVEMQASRDAVANESKSSAGDKHETARAMAQLEQENLGKQLSLVEQLELSLEKISEVNNVEVVCPGSLVETSQMNLYIGPALGELNVGDQRVFAVSMASPLVKVLLNKRVGDSATFNGKQISIKSIS